MAERNSTLTAYRQASISATPVVRPVVTVGLLVVCIVLLYGGLRAQHEGADPRWWVAVACCALFVARGMYLRRPITLPHLTVAVLLLALAESAHRWHHAEASIVLLAASGFVLVAPLGSKPQPEQLRRVADLVDRTTADPLAPFALHSSKSYFFNAASSAAIAYRTRFGIACVAGDPIGDRAAFGDLIAQFSEFAASNGWRVAVLGASPEVRLIWSARALWHRGLTAIPIGRDVVLDVENFNMVGRKFRNLRQAVSRTHNFGVTTEVIPEAALPVPLRDDLYDIVDSWHHGRQTRGFSMILDHLLDGRHPGMLVVLARDSTGQVAGFQRYGSFNGGRELSLDVPWRRKGAPNGLDERMIVDLVDYAREHGIIRISLAFAAFPEIFADKQRGRTGQLIYRAVHLGDPLIRLESLYRFLRKFNALGDQRFVMVRLPAVLLTALALFTLEFVPHRKQE